MAGPALQFRVADAAIESLLRLVASYGASSAAVSCTIDTVSDVEFIDDQGRHLQGLLTAARYAAQSSPKAAELLGQTHEQQAIIAEWLTFSRTELSPLLDDNLAKVNDWLTSRTFLAGNSITMADLVVYAAVAPAASAFPVAQYGHFRNLLRWYDHVHAVADPTGLFPAARFEKPKLVPPSPAAAKVKAGDNDTARQAKADTHNGAEDGKKKKKSALGEQKPTTEGGTSDAKSAPPPATPAASSSEGEKKEKPAKSAKKDASGTSETQQRGASDGPGVDALDIRVGVITKVAPHPNADSLYVEEIDLGEDAPRQVVSGLRKFVPLEKMEGRRVVVVCNLKPAKMREVMSYGMVLCASNAEHTVVDPIIPPEGAKVGEAVTFEGYAAQPEVQLNPRKKVWEKVAPELKTDQGGLCTYRGVPFMTSDGPIKASLPDANIA